MPKTKTKYHYRHTRSREELDRIDALAIRVRDSMGDDWSCDEQAYVELELASRPITVKHAKLYNVREMDLDDKLQCMRMAILSCVKGFDEKKGRWSTYWAICCPRWGITHIIKGALNDPNNHTLTIHAPTDDRVGDDSHSMESSSLSVDPMGEKEASIERAEKWGPLLRLLRRQCTDVENKVLTLYLSGMSYMEMASAMNIAGRKKKHPRKTPKSAERERFMPPGAKVVDNALMRIKKKAAIILQEQESTESTEKHEDERRLHSPGA